MMIALDHNGAIWSSVPIPWPMSPPVSSVSTESAFLARPPLTSCARCPHLPPALLILLNCCLIIASPSPGHSHWKYHLAQSRDHCTGSISVADTILDLMLQR